MNRTRIDQPKSVNGAFDELLNKMYISNVQNRLRQLNEPTDNDCKRWVWELIQNAKDSISDDSERNSVDIKLIIRDREVRFCHNGSPFTAKAQLGLLYKYSEGKVNNSESTGRFGTGFLTTHTLSKTVTIEGDVYTDDTNTTLCGFSATMFRDGLDEFELLEGVKRMKETMEYTAELNTWTTYTYHLKTPQNDNALKLGLENFFSNITQTMLFCKELSNFELDNNGVVTKIIRHGSKNLDDQIYLSEFEIVGHESSTRRFIHTSLNKYNDELSKRFKTERDLRLTAAIEIDSQNSLVENLETPSHYCVLPLVGSEKHIIPFYLNSPDFEPDSERESLILIGDDILADKGVISDGGINRLILLESVGLYESLVKYLSEADYSKLFLLAKGLKKTPKLDKNFNKIWFEEKIIYPFREVLKNYKVVETTTENQKLFKDDGSPHIIIPKDSDLKTQEDLYNLVDKIFPTKLPLKATANAWADFAWKDCGLFDIENLCKYIEKIGNADNLQIESSNYEWLNNFLHFVKNVDEVLLKKFAIVPNQKGVFMSIESENFAEGIGLTDYMIETLTNLGDDLNSNLLNNKITVLNLPLKIDAKVIADKINDNISDLLSNEDSSIEETLYRLLPLLSNLPKDEVNYSRNFLEKQRHLYNFSKHLFPEIIVEAIVNDDIPEKGWYELHNWLVIQLMVKVSGYKNLNSLPNNIENTIFWIDNFISFVSKEIKEGQLDDYAIIPNQKNDFCFKADLSRDMNIPPELKSEVAEMHGIKLKENLLHNGITHANITKENNINTVIEIINTIFKESNFGDGYTELDFAIFLISYLPDDQHSILFKTQRKLLHLVKIYDFKQSELNRVFAIACTNEELWRRANDIIVKDYLKRIEEDRSVNGLRDYLSEQGERLFDDIETMNFLNSFYDYLSGIDRKITGRIFPNQNGDFCSLDDEFYKDDSISEDLKKILYLVNPKEDFKNILADRSLCIQPPHFKSFEDIAGVIDDCIKDTYLEHKNWDDPDFKSAVHLLMINFFPKLRDKQSKAYFQYTYGKKETIEMNVLWSLDERQRMQRAKDIDPLLMDRFIESNGDISLLEKKKVELEAKLAELEKLVTNGVKTEISIEFPSLTVDRVRQLLKLEERILGWNGESDYHPTNEVEEKRNFVNGYKGEAYIYSQLIKSGKFKNVIWDHKSAEPTEMEIIDYENNIHYIKDNGSKYDLLAETYEGNKLFIEVKSTRTSIEEADKIALPISSREWKFVNQINIGDKYCLARVFDVEKNPEGHYLSVMGIGITSNY